MKAVGIAGRQNRRGWHQVAARKRAGKLSVSAQPTQWELLLAELGLTDESAVAAVQDAGERGRELRTWIQRKCVTRYVPEAVLDALDMVLVEIGGRNPRMAFKIARAKGRPGMLEAGQAFKVNAMPRNCGFGS
jgi:hypothetical protein